MYDTRRHTQPLVQLFAHSALAATLDWHPTLPRVIATGGRDNLVQIWHLDSPQSPQITLQCIGPVGKVAWQPGSESESPPRWPAALAVGADRRRGRLALPTAGVIASSSSMFDNE